MATCPVCVSTVAADVKVSPSLIVAAGRLIHIYFMSRIK